MTKEQYLDLCLRYKGYGVLFPLYEKLNRFEKMWFTAIQKDVADLEKENAELKKNYEDSLVACGVLKEKIDLLSKPSPVEAMQDVLITTQKEVNKKQRDQITKAKEIIQLLLNDFLYLCDMTNNSSCYESIEQAEQFLKEK